MAMAGELARQRVSRSALEGEGVSSQLFELLWKWELKGDASLALRIPDTVIFRFNFPVLWYFTSVDGTIKRKTKAKLTNEHILKEFLKRPSASGIAASFITSVPEGASAAGDGSTVVSTRTVVEYLSPDGLREFLGRDRAKGGTGEGILQKFIEPKGESNNMIRALWSPNVCLLERRINRLPLKDTRYNMYERAVTFEGPDFNSDIAPVKGPTLVKKVNDMAEAIVSHVSSSTHEQIHISRLALNFKVDSKDRLWLLFASSVRLRDNPGARQPLKKPFDGGAALHVPEHVPRLQSLSRSRPAAICNSRCPACQCRVVSDTLHEVSYKVLCEYAERLEWLDRRSGAVNGAATGPLRAASAPDLEESAGVPAVLQQLHPRLTAEEFEYCRNDVAFLFRTAAVCEACFLKYSTPQLGPVATAARFPTGPGLGASDADASATPGEMTQRLPPGAAQAPPLFGTEKLDPERLRERRGKTMEGICSKACEEERLEDLAERRKRLEQQAEAFKQRARSCPKLPSWGAGQNGHVVFPPSPVLRAPRPPLYTMGKNSSLPPRPVAANPPPPPQQPAQRSVNPYLHELQEFAAAHRGRAAQVLGQNYLLASALPPLPRPAVPTDDPPADAAAPTDPGGGAAAAASQGAGPVALGTSAEGHTAAAAEGPAGAAAAAAAAAAAGSLGLDGLDLSEDEDDGEAFGSGDAIVAQLWEKWPPSCGSGEGTGGRATPSTQVGSGAPSSRPTSSYLNSRPSTRPTSGLNYHSSAATRTSSQGSRRSLRPTSSPQIRSQLPPGAGGAGARLRRASSMNGLREGAGDDVGSLAQAAGQALRHHGHRPLPPEPHQAAGSLGGRGSLATPVAVGS